MNLNYKIRFEPALLGHKLHTIRTKGCLCGTSLNHIVNPYNKNRRIVLSNTCTGCQTIEIRPCYEMTQSRVLISGVELSLEQTQQLAWNDGFSCLIEFWLYFQEPFTGYIIHWTELKY